MGIPWYSHNYGEGGSFSYQQIGKTESGLYVLLTENSGEGWSSFDVVLVRLERDSFIKVEIGHDPQSQRLIKYPRFLLKLVGTITNIAEAESQSNHQFNGEVLVKGNKLHIINIRGNAEGGGKQEVVIDLETME